MRNDVAVFILTHGRADKQKTIETMYRCGYSGRMHLIIDDEDRQKEEYHEKYGDMVIEFSKKEIEPKFDTMTNQREYRSVVYARNASFEIARKLGVRYFLTCDDDVSDLTYRVVSEGKLKGFKIADIDRLLTDIVEYMEQTGICVFGFSQCGAYLGGANSTKYKKGCQRNISQVMMFDTENPLEIRGLFNEDLCLSLDAGLQGKIGLATMLVSITSPERMTNAGGLHDLYKENNTYVRDFYSKMAHPYIGNFVQDGTDIHIRLNHKAFAPEIISSRYRRA